MRLLYKQTLLKSGYFSMGNSETRVIDTNELVAKKIEQLKEQVITNTPKTFPNDFSGALDAGEVAKLLADTDDEGMPDEAGQESYANGIPASLLANAEEAANEILENARKEAEAIIENAKIEAENMKEAAFQNAQENGRKSGYESGMNQAMLEFTQKQEELNDFRIQLEKDYTEKLDEMEPLLVDTIADVYEHIFKVDLETRRNLVLKLVSETIHKIDSSRNFIVHVSAEDYAEVKGRKEELLAACSMTNATVEVIEDISLVKDECLIETDGGIYDCSLSGQLEQLRNQLRLISYEKA